MIQALIDALRALAASADMQIQRLSDRVGAQEFVLAFDDAYMLARDCRQLTWTRAQLEALDEIDRELSRITAQANSALWTEDALRDAPEWQHVRVLAERALEAVGMSAKPANPTRPVHRASRPSP
jgi:hypothetical protein